jgi:hypothetical protein
LTPVLSSPSTSAALHCALAIDQLRSDRSETQLGGISAWNKISVGGLLWRLREAMGSRIGGRPVTAHGPFGSPNAGCDFGGV